MGLAFESSPRGEQYREAVLVEAEARRYTSAVTMQWSEANLAAGR